MHRHFRRDLSFDLFELRATFGVDQRHDDFQRRIAYAQQLGRPQKIGAEHFDFRMSATGQQREAERLVANA